MFDDSCIRVPLPSKGLLYGELHPLHNLKHLYIKPMTPTEENIIFNRTFHSDGTLSARLIKACVLRPELSIEQAEELVSGDKQVILLSLRISGYGSIIEGELSCPSCETKQDYFIQLSKARIEEFSLKNGLVQNPVFSNSFSYGKINFSYETKLNLTKISDEERKLSEFLNSHITNLSLQEIYSLPLQEAKKIKILIESTRPWVYLDFNFSCVSCNYHENKQISCDESLFPLKPEDRESIFLEPFFTLMYYGGISWETYMNFPVEYKRWLIKRIEKEIKTSTENKQDINSKAPHENTPQFREMTGKIKQFTPNAKMQRF